MYEFINPYNFVPMGSIRTNGKDKRDAYRGDIQKELVSGCLEIKMLLKTPLMIPDGAHPKYYDIENKQYVKNKDAAKNKNLHKEYDFLKMYNPETGEKGYAVPGSELRGLIRSAYEAVTDSCMPFLKDDKPMSQRVPLYGALSKRGLLGYDGKKWILYSTEKKLEEVLVISVYEVNGLYFAESIDRIRNKPENNKKDKNGNYKYSIMNYLDEIEKKLLLQKWGSENIQYGAVFKKNGKKWDIMINGEPIKKWVDKKITGYLFIKADGSAVTERPGQDISGKGVIQYNVPVDLSGIYHVAYLSKKDAVYTWDESSPKGKGGDTDAEAYKKLRSALVRDGAEFYIGNGNSKRRKNGQTNRKCNEALEEALENACNDPEQLVPVYYFIVNKNKCEYGKESSEKIVYMSGSAAGRIAQRRKWKEIMEGHTPCTDKLCPACLLFGTIADKGMKGHVRFTDAFMDNVGNPECSIHTLQTLSSPRTTAFEFYLKKPVDNATYWNYDFFGITEGEGENSHTDYYHLDNAMPRGRKMYWHHSLSPDNDQKSKMNNTIQSIDKGVFSFKVFFDQITREQLTDLLWVITLGDNKEDSKLQHHLGHARPLGYGSVKLLVANSMIRKFYKDATDGGFRFTIGKITDMGIDLEKIKPSFDTDKENVKSFLTMCSEDAVGERMVDYPRVSQPKVKEDKMVSAPPIYEWFSQNRTNSKRLAVLPEPLERDLSLKGEGEKESDERRKKNLFTVVLTELKPDRKKGGMNVGYFDGGIVFDIPANVNVKEKEVRVRVTNSKNGKRFCQFVELL